MRLEFRSMPIWLLREYLIECGGKTLESDIVEGNGWLAHLSKEKPFRIGSLEVGVTILDLEGKEQKIEILLQQLKKKTLRAGG